MSSYQPLWMIFNTFEIINHDITKGSLIFWFSIWLIWNSNKGIENWMKIKCIVCPLFDKNNCRHSSKRSGGLLPRRLRGLMGRWEMWGWTIMFEKEDFNYNRCTTEFEFEFLFIRVWRSSHFYFEKLCLPFDVYYVPNTNMSLYTSFPHEHHVNLIQIAPVAPKCTIISSLD